MMKQLRFYNMTSDHNNPVLTGNTLTENPWVTNILEGYKSVVKIGIQTLPGVKFYFVNNEQNPTTAITIDHSGIYELDLRNVAASIETLVFDPDSLALINSIDNAGIILDIAYASGTS